MRRRELLATFALVLAPLDLARAQQRPRTSRIGYLSPGSPPDPNIDNLRRGMTTLGYVEGQSYVIEPRYAHLDYGRFQPLVQELLGLPVDLVVTGGPAIRAAPFAAQSVPVVFGFSGNPVDAGVVASFARPGGNATGMSYLALDLAAKRVDILKEFAPTIRRLAVLSNPDHPGEASELRVTQEAAAGLGITVQYHPVKGDDAFASAFAVIASGGSDALLTFPDAVMMQHRVEIARFARQAGIPSMFAWRPFAEAGGLLSYGPVLPESYAHLAVFVDKILRGARPGDIPVEQPTKLELVVNLATAKMLGLMMPAALIARADEIIE